jgi:Cys-rich protein (TIGR04453 family)
MNKKIYLAILGFGLLFGGANSGLFANDCVQACEKFISCTEEINSRKATANEKSTLEKACSQTCAKQTAKVLECFSMSKAAGNSCGPYQQCIMKYASAKKTPKK